MAAMMAACSAAGDAAAAAAAVIKAHRAASGLMHSAARLARAAAQLLEEEVQGAGQSGSGASAGRRKLPAKIQEKKNEEKEETDKQKQFDRDAWRECSVTGQGDGYNARVRRRRRGHRRGARAEQKGVSISVPPAPGVLLTGATCGSIVKAANEDAADAQSPRRAKPAGSLSAGFPSRVEDETGFCPEQRVLIHGLVAMHEHNGKEGTVVERDVSRQCWIVRTDDGTCAKFKAENMSACATSHEGWSWCGVDPFDMLSGMGEEEVYRVTWCSDQDRTIDPIDMLSGMCKDDTYTMACFRQPV